MNRHGEYSLAVLMVEDEEGTREPIGIVTTRREADELAEADLKRRKSLLDAGDDPGICPYVYQIWDHLANGYAKVEEWPC